MENSACIQKITAADLAVCQRADSFLQSAMWGKFKARFGWKAQAFLIEWAFPAPDDSGTNSRPLLVLSRRLAPGLSFAYIPWGPELPEHFPAAERNRALSELARALRRFLPRAAAFIRFDPPWFAGDAAAALPLSAPFKRAAADIQPPDTVLVDITPPLPDILAAMKPKCRYNIGLAEKHGVVVSPEDANGMETFYRLLSETALRDGIAIHSIDYYKTLFEICGAESDTRLRLYTARHEDDVLAAIVTLFRGKQAVYLYGASSNVKRNLMAPYALQRRAIQDAKAEGCAVYDLFGIPPNEDPGHPMAGLYRFKTGFGGRIIHRPGSWDYAYSPFLYSIYKTAEKIRKKFRDKKKRCRK